MSVLRPNILAAKERLADGHEDLRRRHTAGAAGLDVSVALCSLRDDVIQTLYRDALEDLGDAGGRSLADHVALVAHGGYGRRDIAPFSDVDLIVLHDLASEKPVVPLVQRLLRDVFDAGLMLGHGVYTAAQACETAFRDCTVCTSLIESRFLAGNEQLFQQMWDRFCRQLGRRAAAMLPEVDKARAEERIRYGETVFLLEPNIKRSRGTLRDIQLIRWLGFVRYQYRDPRNLQALGELSEQDCQALLRAHEFLIRLRNEMHFHAGKPGDVLTRSEQLRIAELSGYPPVRGMLPVEQFMREYFRHTEQVSHVVSRFVTKVQARPTRDKLVTALLGHRAGAYRVGPSGIVATRAGRAKLERDLDETMRLVELSSRYGTPIASATWDVVRQAATHLATPLTPAAFESFLSTLGNPARLGNLLRDLHETGLLERFIPAFAHARGLLQFNQYHKYTVDEHCLRAVEAAVDLLHAQGPLAHVYQALGNKRVLHLALLIHDLGKGLGEDHVLAGARIAAETAQRLNLPPLEAETLQFLIANHQMMGHVALRRDTSDPQLLLKFALDVQTPERLKMLYVLTACDFTAVGPDVWDSWKAELLTDLYRSAVELLAGDSTATTFDAQLRECREQIAAQLGSRAQQPWFVGQLDSLPHAYLVSTPPRQIADDLVLLSDIASRNAAAQGQYLADIDCLLFTVATRDDVVPGIFHRLTGVLSSHGLEIRSAQINTLADGLVIDRFWVYDPDYSGESPPERLHEVERSLETTLFEPTAQSPGFRRTWQSSQRQKLSVGQAHTRVHADNTSSRQYTVLDVFAHDRTGLLYAITRKLFELGLSVGRARIATHLDQVLDVFYVTDAEGSKIEDQQRLADVCRQIHAVIEGHDAG